MNSVNNTKGIYVAVRYSANSKSKLAEFMTKFDIPNRISVDKLHTTLIYSRLYDDVVVNDNVFYIAKPKKFEIWPTQNGNNALVLKLTSPELVDRHNYLMKNYNLTYDYDEYKPHITLSYNVPTEYNMLPLIDAIDELGYLNIFEEYKEDLVLDWADTA